MNKYLNKGRLCNNPKCSVYFIPTSPGHRYCGSHKLKIGCSYKNRLELNKKYVESTRKYQDKWRELNKDRINALRRTPEYHFKVKLYKYRKAKEQSIAINNYHGNDRINR